MPGKLIGRVWLTPPFPGTGPRVRRWLWAGSGWAHLTVPAGTWAAKVGYVHGIAVRTSPLSFRISSGQHPHHQAGAEPSGRQQELPKQAMGTQRQSHAGIKIRTSTMVFLSSSSIWAHLPWEGRLVPLLLHPHLILVPRRALPQPQEGSQRSNDPLLMPRSFGNVAILSIPQGAESFWAFGGA